MTLAPPTSIEDTAQWNVDWGQRIADEAYGSGVRFAVLSPGSRNTPLSLAFHLHPGIHTRVVLDERTAAFLALGFARASDTTAALVCTSGSALAHYFPALLEAKHTHVSLMVLSADRPIELQERGAPQTMNQRHFFGDFTVGFEHFPAPDPRQDMAPGFGRLTEIMDRARMVPRGPVHLNFAFREPLWHREVKCRATRREARPMRGVETHEQGPAITVLRRLIQTHERGVFICGPQAFRRATTAVQLFELAEQIGWPVLAEAASGARFATESPALVTTYDAIFRSQTGSQVEAQCVVRFGQSSTSKPLSKWISGNTEAEFVVINEEATRYDPERTCDKVLRGRADRVISALNPEQLPSRKDRPWAKTWRRWEADLRQVFRAQGDVGFWEGGIARTLLTAMPANSAVHVANSMSIRDVDAFCPASNGALTVYVNRGLNGIDGTIATTAGESLVHEGNAVALLIGDLAFLHDAASLQVFGANPVTIVVLDNGGGQIFRFLPISAHQSAFETLFVTPQKASPEQVCMGFGIRHFVVDSMPRLAERLDEEIPRAGLSVIIAKIDAETNHARHEALWKLCVDRLDATP